MRDELLRPRLETNWAVNLDGIRLENSYGSFEPRAPVGADISSSLCENLEASFTSTSRSSSNPSWATRTASRSVHRYRGMGLR
jgi:hypothetical protein